MMVSRDPALKNLYASAALAEIPRLLGAIDRNPCRPTYGCLDREYWHYRTASFASGMHQEGCLPLALVYTQSLPGNRWRGEPRVRELAIAAIRYAARGSHADGSCDDYYPFERALGAAVFSLQAAAEAYRLLVLDDRELLDWLRRRARWVATHDESGRLANHHALAALGLLRVANLTGEDEFRRAADVRLRTVLAWQDAEGWFDEYGGADPGYQTVTIDCLAKYRRLTGDASLDEPLRRAVDFARAFLHPDGSYGGEYGSRGTYHFYPHGFELLAGGNPAAADLADGFLRALAAGKQAYFSDDRLFIHRLGNLIEAYGDWASQRPAALPETASVQRFPRAGLVVRRSGETYTAVSLARGGVFKHFSAGHPTVTDAGLIVETADGRLAVSQAHQISPLPLGEGQGVRGAASGQSMADSPHPFPLPEGEGELSSAVPAYTIACARPLCWVEFETVGPVKQAVLHLGMLLVGRWCRTLVRRLLQRRLITGRRECPIRLTRMIELPGEQSRAEGPALRVTDTIELADRRIRLRRMYFGTDHQAAYVAASGVYQESVLAEWTDLAGQVDELNATGRVTVTRTW